MLFRIIDSNGNTFYCVADNEKRVIKQQPLTVEKISARQVVYELIAEKFPFNDLNSFQVETGQIVSRGKSEQFVPYR